MMVQIGRALGAFFLSILAMTAWAAGPVPDPAGPMPSLSVPVRPPLPTDHITATATTPVSPYGLPCGVQTRAHPRPGGWIDLTVRAPCQPDTLVTARHAGLRLAAKTDGLGHVLLRVPALTQAPLLTVTVGQTDPQKVQPKLADPLHGDRLVIAWRDLPGPRLLHQGGDIQSVGGPQGQALVLTRAPQPHGTRLGLFLPHSDSHCGKPLDVTILQRLGTQPVEKQRLRLRHAPCDGTQDGLTLRAVLSDIRATRLN